MISADARRGRKGQALVELAIFGAVMLGALSFLIRVGMAWNFEQDIRMSSFRRALAAGAADNAASGDFRGGYEDAVATTFHQIANRQLPNPRDATMSLPRMRTEASAFVEWGNRLTFANITDANEDNVADGGIGRETQQKIIVRSDGEEIVLRQEDVPASMDSTKGNATKSKIPNPAIIRESTTDNITVEARAWQKGGASHIRSQTITTTESVVNTTAEDGLKLKSTLTPPQTKVDW